MRSLILLMTRVNYLSSPNSDGLGEVSSDEEFELQYVLAPFELVFRKLWICASRFFWGVGEEGVTMGEGSMHVFEYVCMHVCM